MSLPRRPNDVPLLAADALLSGLSRLKTADPSPVAPTPTAPKPDPRSHPRGTRTRSSASTPAAFNVPYAYFPLTTSGRRPDPLIPVSRADILELVERATGLHHAGGGDIAAAEKLLRWIRAGSADVVDVFTGIIAGSQRKDAALNARVLSVVAWLCVNGGPEVLYPAVYVVSARRPSPGVKVCIDVLRSLGYDLDPESVLHDDNKVRELANMRLTGDVGVRGRRRALGREALFEIAVEAYAIALGRKLVFHRRFPEVEVNYSLDRHYRKLHVEERFDRTQRDENMERLPLVISKACLADMVLIARCAVIAADRLEAAGAPDDIWIPATAEACNAYAFSEYLRKKTEAKQEDVWGLEEERICLSDKLLGIESKGGPGSRLLRRYVEENVFRAITDPHVRAHRPESKHRREILCAFMSFRALHLAFAPDGQGHRDIAD